MITIIDFAKTEFLKLRKKHLWLICIFFAFFSLVPGTIYRILRSSIGKVSFENWNSFIASLLHGWTLIFLPFYILILAVIICSVEHKNGMLKLIYIQSITRWKIYIIKNAIYSVYILASNLFLFFFIYLSIFVLNNMSATNLGYPPAKVPLILILSIFISSLPIQAIQYFVAYRFENIFISFCVTIFGIILCGALYSYNEMSFNAYLPWNLTSKTAEIIGQANYILIFFICGISCLFSITILLFSSFAAQIQEIQK